MEDAAHREAVERDHVPERVGEGVHLEAGVEAVDADGELIRRLPAAVDADRDPEPLGLRPHHVEGRVVQVLLPHVLGDDHAHQAELGGGAAELRHRRLRVDHRELGDGLEARGVVPVERGLGIVDRAAEGRGEVAVEERPLLAGAARKRGRHVDAFEVHVGQARDRVAHAGPLVETVTRAREPPAGQRKLAVVVPDPLAVLRHERLQAFRHAVLPVGLLAAVSVRIDDVEAVSAHRRAPQRPMPFMCASRSPSARCRCRAPSAPRRARRRSACSPRTVRRDGGGYH